MRGKQHDTTTWISWFWFGSGDIGPRCMGGTVMSTRSSVVSHTRGPWHVYAHRDSDTVAVFDFRNNPSKPVIEWVGFDGNYIRDFDKNFANAKLIAAAPDLLKAVKGVLDDLECGEGCGAPPEYSRRVEACRRAIAKAEGDHV